MGKLLPFTPRAGLRERKRERLASRSDLRHLRRELRPNEIAHRRRMLMRLVEVRATLRHPG
jgi:hypothetical protein